MLRKYLFLNDFLDSDFLAGFFGCIRVIPGSRKLCESYPRWRDSITQRPMALAIDFHWRGNDVVGVRPQSDPDEQRMQVVTKIVRVRGAAFATVLKFDGETRAHCTGKGG